MVAINLGGKVFTRKTKALLTAGYGSYGAGAYVLFQGIIVRGIVPDWLLAVSAVFAFIIPLAVAGYFIKRQHILVPKADFDLVLAVGGFVVPVLAGSVAALLGDPDLGLNDIVFFSVGLIFGVIGFYRGMEKATPSV